MPLWTEDVSLVSAEAGSYILMSSNIVRNMPIDDASCDISQIYDVG